MKLTYGLFHLIFNVPVLLLLLWMTRKIITREHLKWMGLVLAIVIVFTTPWDNWAVMKKIWDFDPNRIWFRIGYLPLEEYLFFVFESLNVMLFTFWMIHRRPSPREVA